MIVDLILSEEQQLIEESVKAFLRDRLPIERLRETRAHGGGAEAKLWEELAGLGLFGLGLPITQGGSGLCLAEEALVARAFGANLVSPSVLAQLVAPHFAWDNVVRSALVTGKARATFAAVGGHALDPDGADWLLVLAPGGASLIAAADAQLGAPVTLIDETVAARSLGASPKGASASIRISLIVAAYLTGVAQTATAMAVDYARVREQFGQPIGAFQAIKHMAADMAVRAAAADAQLFYAAVTFEHAENPAGESAAARLLAEEAARENAAANIQIHGGMGFTAECDAHLLLKRAQLIAALGADRTSWRADLLAV